MIKKCELNIKGISVVSWIVFVATLIVVLITLTSVVFPAFIIGSFGGIKYPIEINIFETGIWTSHFVITNVTIFGLALAYWKNFLPNLIRNAIKFVFEFEVSKKVALFTVLTLLGIYIGFSVNEIFLPDPWIDFDRYVKGALERWTLPTTISGLVSVKDPVVAQGLGVASMYIFGTYSAIPFISSIALLGLTYLITVEISKKRFAGIVAMAIVLQSGIFLNYDTTITYPSFWALFYILSLYTVYKFWPMSPVSFILAIPSKAISAVFLPINLFFVYRAKIPKRRKIILLIIYSVIACSGLVLILSLESGFIANVKDELEFDAHAFWSGFTAFSYEFRFDGLMVLFLLPLTVGLFFVSKSGVKSADSILMMIFWTLFLAALLPALTDFTNNPYRFVPFVIFFAMGVGTLLSKKPVKPLA